MRPLALMECQAVLNFLGIGRHGDHQFRAVVKANQEEASSSYRSSSSGFAVFMNCETAWRDFMSLAPMLPLVSKTMPTESGASSLEN